MRSKVQYIFFFVAVILLLPNVLMAQTVMISYESLIQERIIWGGVVSILVVLVIFLEIVRRKQRKISKQSYLAQKEKITFLEAKVRDIEQQKTKPSRVNKPKFEEEVESLVGGSIQPTKQEVLSEMEVEEFTSSRMKGVHGDSLKVVENDDVGELTIMSTHNLGKSKLINPKEFIENTLEEVKPTLPENVSVAVQIGGAPMININQNVFEKAINALIRCSANTIEGNGKITVSLYASMGEAQVSISDNGKGWGYDGQDTDDLKTLDLAKKILKSQGATFDMNTQLGKGTEIVISIPNKK
ncbi:HAMP domain-containing histidine kinase [Flammeovirga agarivorans]|uniref:HAMP domain-containing histidine kinase n=1 Tax=Flammeovirga agarivorans TaxID=2726742 RepID=A0A7X8SI82_9BACT|nr:HAMP domain-containing histidine kinase [Flammeovirga agarivorans]NLR90578.1 HAMP domain-containing histidine kinase [Flammeovirga agarivorans]